MRNGLASPPLIRHGAVSDYKNGMLMKQITYKWGVHRSTVDRWVNKAGFKKRIDRNKTKENVCDTVI